MPGSRPDAGCSVGKAGGSYTIIKDYVRDRELRTIFCCTGLKY